MTTNRERGCTPACATPIPCETCGNDLPPRGRSVPMAMGMPSCCEATRYDDRNTRHLWRIDELDD